MTTDAAHTGAGSSSSGSSSSGYQLAEMTEGAEPGDRDVMGGSEGMDEGGEALDPDAPGQGLAQPSRGGGMGAIAESSLAGQGLSQGGLALAPSTNPFAGTKPPGPFGTYHQPPTHHHTITSSHRHILSTYPLNYPPTLLFSTQARSPLVSPSAPWGALPVPSADFRRVRGQVCPSGPWRWRARRAEPKPCPHSVRNLLFRVTTANDNQPLTPTLP